MPIKSCDKCKIKMKDFETKQNNHKKETTKQNKCKKRADNFKESFKKWEEKVIFNKIR